MGIVTGAPGTVTLSAADGALALAAVKGELRAAATDDDALVIAFAETALGLAEQFTGDALILREMVADLPGTSGWQRLPATPVRTIGVASVPTAALDIDADGIGWVRSEQPVRVTFGAGRVGGWALLPPALRQGVVMLAAHLFSDRTGTAPVPAAVTALWRPFRTPRLATERRA